MAAIPLHEEIDYPTADGQPMAETTLHRKIMTDMIEGLERHFQVREEAAAREAAEARAAAAEERLRLLEEELARLRRHPET